MSRTAASLARECRSFSKTLSAGPSRCLHTPRDASSFVRPISTTSRHQHAVAASTRRTLHTARTATSGKDTKHSPEKKLKDDLRALLRDVAQPVAVVTSFMPSGNDAPASIAGAAAANGVDESELESSRYHGATLSSFTSIAMDPYPLVAFALRIPSRMATSLSSLVGCSPNSTPSSTSTSSSQSPSLSQSQPPSRSTSSPPPSPSPPPSTYPSHMVINLLSAAQAAEAITFSRPDLYPSPFAGAQGVQYTLSPDGLPVLRGVVGALSCRLVGPPIPLHDLSYFAPAAKTHTHTHAHSSSSSDTGSGSNNGVERGGQACEPVLEQGAVTSELFIAQVVRVEDVKPLAASGSRSDAETETDAMEDILRTLPLVYHRQGYTSCHPKHAGRKS